MEAQERDQVKKYQDDEVRNEYGWTFESVKRTDDWLDE